MHRLRHGTAVPSILILFKQKDVCRAPGNSPHWWSLTSSAVKCWALKAPNIKPSLYTLYVNNPQPHRTEGQQRAFFFLPAFLFWCVLLRTQKLTQRQQESFKCFISKTVLSWERTETIAFRVCRLMVEAGGEEEAIEESRWWLGKKKGGLREVRPSS